MASREISSILRQEFVFNIDNITSNGNETGGILTFDSAGFESVEFFIISTNDYTDGTYLMLPRHGDVSDNSQHVAVPSDELTDTPPTSPPFIFGVNQVSRVGYFGKKRFLSTHITVTDVTVGARIGVFIVANTPRHAVIVGNV